MAEHTPTPWHVEKYDTSEFSESHFRIVGPWSACHVARTHGESLGDQNDAMFIIKSANAHADLVAVARMVDAWGNGLRHQTAHESAMVKAARAVLVKLES